jgi:hypothetical protein
LAGKHKSEYVTCRICKQRIRGDKFERHAMMHWIMSSTDKGFREFYAELRKEVETADA